MIFVYTMFLFNFVYNEGVILNSIKCNAFG